jgi:membrane dipeptidase
MSYEYLGKNVVPVALAKEVDRITEKTVALSPAEEERAMRLHRESIVIDFHVHLTILPENLGEYDRLARSGRPATGFEGTRRSGLTGCLLAFAGSMVRRSSPAPWKFEDLVWDLGVRWADMDHRPDLFLRAYTAADIVRAKQAGRTAVLAMAENTQMVDNDLDRLDVLYGLGIRSLGLTYSARTTAGDGCNERTDAGLSRFGLKVIERMNRLGMLIDLSPRQPGVGRGLGSPLLRLPHLRHRAPRQPQGEVG